MNIHIHYVYCQTVINHVIMKKFSKKAIGGRTYESPDLMSESVLAESGYCTSAASGNSNEAIGDEQKYDFRF